MIALLLIYRPRKDERLSWPGQISQPMGRYHSPSRLA